MVILCVASIIVLLLAGEALAVLWVVVPAIWAAVAIIYQHLYEEAQKEKEEKAKKVEALKTERNHYLALYCKYHDLYINCTDDAAEDKE